jgi:D-cysteine desulfhydrase
VIDLPTLPRVALLDGPTPLQRLERLSAALGGRVELWIKREDLGPLAFSGNKLRNLEFLLGAAIAAVRRQAPAVVLVGPIARYLIAPARSRDDVRWDRLTGVAQMALLGAVIARLPARWASIPVTAARCAALAVRMAPRGRLDLTAQPAEPR